MWFASSMRISSIQNRPAVYAITYSANARPRPELEPAVERRAPAPATPRFHSASYGTSGGRGRVPDGTGWPSSRSACPGLSGSIRWISQAPRQAGPPAVQLVVEPVAEPADRLGHRQARARGRRRPRVSGMPSCRAAIQAPTAPPATAPQMPRPPSQMSNAFERVAAGAEVFLGRGDDVVDPGADDAERDRPHRDVEHRAGGDAALAQPCSVTRQATTMPSDDAERVRPERDRPELPDGGASGWAAPPRASSRRWVTGAQATAVGPRRGTPVRSDLPPDLSHPPPRPAGPFPHGCHPRGKTAPSRRKRIPPFRPHELIEPTGPPTPGDPPPRPWPNAQTRPSASIRAAAPTRSPDPGGRADRAAQTRAGRARTGERAAAGQATGGQAGPRAAGRTTSGRPAPPGPRVGRRGLAGRRGGRSRLSGRGCGRPRPVRR